MNNANLSQKYKQGGMEIIPSVTLSHTVRYTNQINLFRLSGHHGCANNTHVMVFAISYLSVCMCVNQCSEATAGQRSAASPTKRGKLSVKYFQREWAGQTPDRQKDRQRAIRNAASYRDGPVIANH